MFFPGLSVVSSAPHAISRRSGILPRLGYRIAARCRSYGRELFKSGETIMHDCRFPMTLLVRESANTLVTGAACSLRIGNKKPRV